MTHAPLGPLSPEKALGLVRGNLDDAAGSIVPWFYETMPDYYFRTHTEEEQVRHLQALVSGQVTTQRQSIILRGPDQTRVTHISPAAQSDELKGVLKTHARDDIQTARIYTSKDGALQLSTFLLAPQDMADPTSQEFQDAVAAMLTDGLLAPKLEEEFREFLGGATRDYVEKFEPLRAARHFELARVIAGGEDVALGLEPIPQTAESRLSLGMSSPPSRALLYQITRIFCRKDVDIHRAYADSFHCKQNGHYGIISFYVSRDGKAMAPDSAIWQELRRELALVKWMAPHDLEACADEDGFTMRQVMLAQAASDLAHQFLIKSNLHAFTADNVVRALLGRRDILRVLVEFFETRFNPEFKYREAVCREIEAKARGLIEQLSDDLAREIFLCILRFFKSTLRTNYFLESIYGLAFRLDPAILDTPKGEETPFGVFFFHGPRSQAFHVRYRDMARGGVRVVPTRTQEQFELESNRLIDEVLALARAQQAKNKDIPEGGAKAVILLGPYGDMDLAVKSMFNSLLDVMLPGKDSHTLPGVVDYLGKEELIYLGPDENIAPRHITWAIERARQRGYRWATAFMSSKPRAGINHKEYGVTSLGVIVFAEEMLATLGIDPTSQSFSVKFTGGPKGDVAGNAMKILIERYGANTRIVAVSDGHGAAYDPKGLDHDELLRLIEANESINAFNPARIKSAEGYVADASTVEGARLRNNLHNVAKADLFIPSGGRPETINIRNWRAFLDAEGKPTAKAVIEGANIFLSVEARTKLQETGLRIVHGSSANKTGVICSSYEILGCLVMNEEEFLENKPTYVAQVLEIIQKRARDEARLLLKEYKARGGKTPLTDLTMILSREINDLADLFYASLLQEDQPLDEDEDLVRLFHDYCPPILVQRYAARLLQTPRRYQYALAATALASRLVYAEGLGWAPKLLAVREPHAVMRAYLSQEHRLALFLEQLRDSGAPQCHEMAHVLERSGRKFLTAEALGLE